MAPWSRPTAREASFHRLSARGAGAAASGGYPPRRMPRVFQQLATFGGAAALVAAVFTLLCFVVLPKEQRYRARMPTAMLGLFALAAVVHVITSPEHVVHDAFGTIGLFFLMLSLARTTFLLLYHGIVVRSMSREAPRIIGDLVQGLFFAAALTVVLRAVGKGSGTQHIDVQVLDSGSYVAKVRTSRGLGAFRFIKE